MSAFATALAALVADANLGVEAIFRQGGMGAPVPLRLVRSSPDRVADAFGTEIISATDILTVSTAALPVIAAGDSFALGAELLTVTHAERDASGAAWRVHCQQ